MDIQRERLQELESELTRWRHDAVVNDQNHAIELQQIKAQIISLVASGKLGDEKVMSSPRMHHCLIGLISRWDY